MNTFSCPFLYYILLRTWERETLVSLKNTETSWSMICLIPPSFLSSSCPQLLMPHPSMLSTLSVHIVLTSLTVQSKLYSQPLLSLSSSLSLSLSRSCSRSLSFSPSLSLSLFFSLSPLFILLYSHAVSLFWK
jgi:hypothetical protein